MQTPFDHPHSRAPSREDASAVPSAVADHPLRFFAGLANGLVISGILWGALCIGWMLMRLVFA